MTIKKGLLYAVLSIILAGCQTQPDARPVSENPVSSDEEPQQENQANSKDIWLYLYRENPLKSQPELIDLRYSPEEVAAVENWLKAGKPDSKIDRSKVDKIYMLQFQFLKDKAVTDQEYYMYIKTNDGSFYAKKFQFNVDYTFEEFHADRKKKLLDLIGMEDWLEVSELPN
ncbi:hypothetical protein [Brevibacillus massiliensis]|jgi:hypothetical protein|uniref:hypothetical protein n=1 Tax=Brevibacillus massiliensis TaxID=1118054 RepID=UPI00047498B0|nr:hypothetical protein [Brevibacillus massiliensis]